MKKISFQDYKEKVRGCFLGKSVGGTLGMPFEGAAAASLNLRYVRVTVENAARVIF